MYIGFYNFYEVYNNNKMFQNPENLLGFSRMYYLGQELLKKGHSINTLDQEKNLFNFDAIVFIDFPTTKNNYFNNIIKKGFKNIYLLIMEPFVIKPDNWDFENHKYFRKIFTWNDTLIDDKKYFKINYSFNIPDEINIDINKKEKLCTIISGNKHVSYKNELYSERLRAIKWFEKNQPGDFDLYGLGWSKYNFKGIFSKLNKYEYLKSFFKVYHPSYRGAVLSKKEILEKYKFSICYENCNDMEGYITEKIFDCFFAGCVPIYLGAPNIENYIPSETFIDKRKFRSYEDLYLFIKNMPEIEYLNYVNAIKNFIKSDKIYIFSIEYFANTIMKEILNDY